MARLSVPLLFCASLLLVVMNLAAANGRTTQIDLAIPESVAGALKSEVGDATKASAKQFFALGLKYRERAENDENWAPAAKAFGESALLYPRPLTLKEYAESTLRAKSKVAAEKGIGEQLQLLSEMLNVYDSAIVADEILHELTSDQRAQLLHYQECSQEYLRDRKPPSQCSPLHWLGLVAD